jgi:hypothetical protein
VLFAITAFVGAGLLFVVQPLVARLVLPHFGGSATVWSTSSLFFQVVLLMGYAYVHLASGSLGKERQLWLHLAVLLLPLAVLPVALPSDASPGETGSPVLWLLRTLLLTIGLPFAVVSTTGPLLQRWYSWTRGPRAEDPYFLFAASNLGSFGGLLVYPFAIEPLLTLDQQRMAWSLGFGAFLALMASCALVALRSRTTSAMFVPTGIPVRRPASTDRPTGRQYALWALLAFLPSTMMLGVTAHVSTDIAAIPLLWVLPLALYLGTFVVAFARDGRATNPVLAKSAVALATTCCLALFLRANVPVLALLLLEMVMLTMVSYAAHSRLAATRPAADHLTAFYLVIAAGGAAGGMLNGLLAPVLLDRVWEYPAALVGSALLTLGVGARRGKGFLEHRYGEKRAAGMVTLVMLSGGLLLVLLGTAAENTGQMWLIVVFALMLYGAWAASARPIPLAVALTLGVACLSVASSSHDLENSRTFYGAYRVLERDGARVLVHGTTVHGKQFRDARSNEPTTYYARSGPLGDVFARSVGANQIGVVGLGTGTIAAYGTSGQTMTFFEIDPEMVRIARETPHFTYIADSAADTQTVVGDGRLQISHVAPETYDLLVLDAFSSDAIPVHLLTQEAFKMYGERLAPGGLLAVHVSNRVFDLEPVVAAAADELGWPVAVGVGRASEVDGATDAVWMVLSADQTKIDSLYRDPDWTAPGAKRVAWTDDFSSVLGVLRQFVAH